MPRSKKILVSSCLVSTLTALGASSPEPKPPAQAGAPTEAPAGFDTPSFNAAHSISNGIVEPPGDTFHGINRSSSRTRRSLMDWALCTTQLPASCAIRIPIAGRPDRSQNCALGTMMRTAIS